MHCTDNATGAFTHIESAPNKGGNVFLSRSRIETFKACPRRGYFEYMYAGIGLTVDPGPVYFDTGNAVHAGLASCLKLIRGGVDVPNRQNISDIIAATLADFDERAGEIGIERLVPHIADLELSYRAEQRDLSVAIVYTWIVNEWESFAQRYEVLAVEMDTHFISQIGPYRGSPAITIHWESKADAIVRERMAPHQISVWSWKSAADTKEWTRRKYRSDLQGYLECWFAEQHTGLTIDFNQVVYLVKGKKLRLSAGGVELPWNADVSEIARYSTDSFLLAPLLKPDDAGNPFFNEIEGLIPNTIWTPSYRRPGNVTDSQYKGWTRPDRFRLTDLDEDGWPLLFRWIDSLQSGSVFPSREFLGGTPAALDRVIFWENQSPRDVNLTGQLLKEIAFETYQYATYEGVDTPRRRRM